MESALATTSSESLAERFATVRSNGRRALVCYVTAGHPDARSSVELLQGLQDAGADVIELGVPFSDPMADGPVIQSSSQKALKAGITFGRVLEIAAQARLSIPVVLFSYLNPVLAAGEHALEQAARAGIGGLLITDLPVGADPALEERFGQSPLDFVRLVAPTTPVSRLSEIVRHGSGFVYLISRLGVTGYRSDVDPALRSVVGSLRTITDMPICAGFGISTPAQAVTMAREVDGIVVGSALVQAADRDIESAVRLAREMRRALDENYGA
jgi:tryptophan synthase alpha chain